MNPPNPTTCQRWPHQHAVRLACAFFGLTLGFLLDQPAGAASVGDSDHQTDTQAEYCYTVAKTAQHICQSWSKVCKKTLAPGGDIAAAIASVSSGAVCLSPGKYHVAASIQLKSNVSLRGLGAAPEAVVIAPLRADQNSALITGQQIQNVAIANLSLAGAIPKSAQHVPPACHETGACPAGITLDQFGILITGDGDSPGNAVNSNIILDGVDVKHCAMGVHIKGTTKLYVTRSRFHENGLIQKYFHNMYLRRVFIAHVRDSVFEDSGSANGLNVSQSGTVLIKNNIFRNNWFRGVRVEGEEEGGHQVVVDYADLYNNRSEGNGDCGYRFRYVASLYISSNHATNNHPNLCLEMVDAKRDVDNHF